MWQGFDSTETDQALLTRAQFPEPERPRRASGWSQMGEILAAPYKGAAQGLNQTLRVANRVASMIPGGASEAIRERNAEISSELDTQFRSGADYWNADPVASTTASQILQQGARVLSKVAGYSLAGGVPGAVVGTALDEGATGFMELRDKGVDPTTAAKVAVVRGAAVGVSVALPVVGTTGLRTAGLVGLGGPGSFMAEQGLSREILEAAQYPELARQYDPTDPMGLALSLAVPGVIGAASHAVRARRSAAAQVAGNADMLDAAHVVYRDEQVKAGSLAQPDDLAAMNTHVDQVRAAAQALDEGRPVSAIDATVDPVRAEAALREIAGRLESARPEIEAALREVAQPQAANQHVGIPTPTHAEPPTVADGVKRGANKHSLAATSSAPREVVEGLARAMGASDDTLPAAVAVLEHLQRQVEAMQRPVQDTPPKSALDPARAVAARSPDLPVRLDENGPAMPARDVVEAVRIEADLDRQDSRAFQAAIECALRSGT